VVGADGGRSTVAQQGGFQIDGESKLGYAINVYIEADLAHLVAHRPATLYWTNYPGREYFFGSGTFTLVRRWDEWTVQFSYDPQAEFLEATEEMLLPRVQEGIGDPDVPVKIKRIGKWELNRLVAREYRRGRLFLAGDAAHRHPPANGLGSNTSIQDSFNLAWKLAAVLSGVADDALLDSYDAERRPVGHQIVERAVASVGLVAALSPKWGIRSGQPEHEGWAELEALFEAKPESSLRREELAEALDEWDYGINAHGVEMGQQYSSKAVIDDGIPDTPPQRDPELYYQATTRPGAHLPHVWLVHEGSRVSSLDLVPSDGWALLTGVGGDDWVEAARKLSAQSGISIATRVVGLGAEYNDSYGEWAKVREISDSGALLIRPDRHIGWRATDLVIDATSVLSQALDAILHPTV
jgi:2,4-dichlorophenol 6-monooxygenase